MRLSEAIRLGAMLKPQAFGDLWRDGGLKSCALGAAYDALGFGHTSNAEDNNDVPQGIRDLLETRAVCPKCARPDRFGLIVTHLNDDHRWKRERIADWVATVEPAETTSAQSSTSDVRGTEAVGSRPDFLFAPDSDLESVRP